MKAFIDTKQAERLRGNLKEDSLQSHLYKVLKDRTLRNTREDRLVQSADTQEWYHLVWERMSDAAFLYYMEKDAALGRWIHDRTMEIVNLPLDAWIGPWFRRRESEKPIGALETSHITLAVCEAYVNAEDIFTEAEKEQIRQALRDKGLLLCRRFLDKRWEARAVHNWFIVILNGFCTAAAVLGLQDEIAFALEMEEVCSRVYNIDSYGESVQYSNYASLHFRYMHRVLVQSGYATKEELHPECYMRLMKWYAYSFQRMKYLESFEAEVPRTFAFGDSYNLFRSTADVLVQTAVWGKEKCPKEAGLAAWLFETTYGKEDGLIDEMATFGFFNQFGYDTLLMMPDMTKATAPKEADLPLIQRFEVGHVIARDDWENPQAMLALSAGYEPLHVSAHRHFDQNSFQLTVGTERILVDPGHCCYRLATQRKSKDETSHNMASVCYQGNLLPQAPVAGENAFRDKPVSNRLIAMEEVNGVTVVISDVTRMYQAPVKRMLRIWLFKLPDMVMVIDDVAAEEPIQLLTRLVANNRDNKLVTDVSGWTGELLNFRRGEETLEAKLLQNETDGVETSVKISFDWSYLHEYYHPLPNQAGQSKEGSALVYVWEDETEGKHHRRAQLLTPGTAKEPNFADKVQYAFTEDTFSVCVDGVTRMWKL